MVESPELDRVFQALADGTRRAILRDLRAGEKPIVELARPHGMSFAAVAKHVQVLERAGLVRRERRGSYAYLTLDGGAMARVDHWLQPYRGFWEGRLDALAALMEEEEP